MARHLIPQSLRGRLAAAILGVAAVVLAGSFLALHERTGDDIRAGIDERLRTDLAEFEASPAARASTPAELLSRSRRFIAAQGYHSDSRIFAITATGITASNQRPLVESEEDEGDDDDEDEEHSSSAAVLLSAPRGLASVDLGDDGELRVLTEPVVTDGRTLGTFRVAESLRPVGFAEGSIRETLLIVGLIALGVLLAAALWVAGLVARPLTRMASFARGVDAGELGRRLPTGEGTSEVRSLAESFNRMLDRLERAFEREREFVADASHELRTPVTIARGELDLAARSATPEQSERIARAQRELRRMGTLIEQMLTLATAESGAAIHAERTPVQEILDDVRRDLPLLGERDFAVAALGGTVPVDPERIAQVFRNLAQNAVAHTEPGGRINVDAEPAGPVVRFAVSDDGEGIDPDDADQIFNRFHRGTGGRGGGRSGLGLAIARAIVLAHGGSIRADGALGRGTTVTFELPGYEPGPIPGEPPMRRPGDRRSIEP